MISLLARPPRDLASKCPLCRDELRTDELRRGDCGHCPSCETRYHRECFAEFGGCSTLGCAAYRQPIRSADRAPGAPAPPRQDYAPLRSAGDSSLADRYSWLKLARVLGAVVAVLLFLACVALEWETGFELAFLLTVAVGLLSVDDWSA